MAKLIWIILRGIMLGLSLAALTLYLTAVVLRVVNEETPVPPPEPMPEGYNDCVVKRLQHDT